MSTAVEKRCVGCGKDVSMAKRTKDAAGRYYCQACYEAAVANKLPSRLMTQNRADGSQSSTQPLHHSTAGEPSVSTNEASESMLRDGQMLKSQQKARPYLKWLAYTAFAVVAAATSFTIYFYKVVEPNQRRMQQNLEGAVAQNEKSSRMAEELTRRQAEVSERRRLFAETGDGGDVSRKAFVSKVTGKSQLSMADAIAADPIISATLKESPSLKPLLYGNNATVFLNGLRNATPPLTKEDEAYFIQFAAAIHPSSRDADMRLPPTPTTGGILGDVWVKKTTGDVIPIAAFEVLLLSPTPNVPVGELHIADAIRVFQIHVDVAQKYPNDAGSQADAKQAAATIAEIDPSQHSNRLAATSIISASETLIDIDAASLRIFEAAGRVKQFQIDSLERKIQSETLWQLVSQTAATKVMTDRDGRFKFSDVKPGEYVVACRAFLPALKAVVYWAEPMTVQSGMETSMSLSADRAVVVGY